MSEAVSAPGKAFLIGEYAVLEGEPALIAAVDVRAVAHDARPEHNEERFESPFLLAAEAQVRSYLRERELEAPSLLPVVTTLGFTAGDRKIGLGSSAAVTSAVVGYHLQAAGLDLQDPSIQTDALRLASLAHREAQSGRGSGGDVAASNLGGTIRFQNGVAEPVDAPPWLKLAFFDAGAPASTESFVSAIRAGAERDTEGYRAAMSDLRAASKLFFQGFVGQDAQADGFSRLVEAVGLHNQGLRRLQGVGDVEILTPQIETIIEAAEKAGLAAKPSGAGGGDLVVVFAADRARLDRFAAHLLRERDIARLDGIGLDPSGLRVDSRPPTNSRLQGFFRVGIEERRKRLAAATGIPLERFDAADPGSLSVDAANHMIENVIGGLALPMAVATNFQINGRDYLVPMCVEEASVVAAASNAAKMVRAGGGFVAHRRPLDDLADPAGA